MARPRNNRIVDNPPLFNEFKPVGVAGRELSKIYLSIDEYEAIRLADKLQLSHLDASKEMDVSRSTFSRLIESARQKIAEFIITGKMLTIEGGNIHFTNNIIKCFDCGHMFNIRIDEHFNECPECKSKNLINIAGNYGHGSCCVEYKGNGRGRKNRGFNKNI
jgi:predicted DNA-binding protein (UPF0251 family)